MALMPIVASANSPIVAGSGTARTSASASISIVRSEPTGLEIRTYEMLFRPLPARSMPLPPPEPS